MGRNRCLRRKLNEFFYEHCKLDKRICCMKKSLYELMGILNRLDSKKEEKKREDEEEKLFARGELKVAKAALPSRSPVGRR